MNTTLDAYLKQLLRFPMYQPTKEEKVAIAKSGMGGVVSPAVYARVRGANGGGVRTGGITGLLF